MEAIVEKDVEVVVDSISEVIATGTVEVDVVDNTDLAVSVNRKEFNIVGDELYIPKRYEDAPQWLRDLISTVTEQSYAQKITELNNLSTSLQQLIVELDVAKNTYTQSIISSNDIDERINTAITTLNSSLSDSDATIVDLISTKATPEEASAIALNTISSSINDGEIGALVGAVSNTLTTETGALANNIDLVHAEMLGGFESTADVIQTTQAYVGIDEAGASTGTGLSAYLEASDGTIGGADSQLANTIRVTAEGVESKFAYNSIVNINGVYKKSGFGLSTNYTSGNGTQANPYVSEFWIDASRLKFTNSNQTGQVAPFTIDATGTTPQVRFNGVVSFSNVTNVPQLGSTPQEVVDAVNSGQTTTINGGKITTGSISADKISTYTLTSTNATIQNSMITNAMIGDAQITSAKIQDLSVSTLKIQDEAVIVPRAASGVGSTTIYYTPSITHSVIFLLTGGFSAYNTTYRLYVNGAVWYVSPSGFGERIALNMLGTLYANTAYTITLNATVQSGYTVPTLQLVMLGVKK